MRDRRTSGSSTNFSYRPRHERRTTFSFPRPLLHLPPPSTPPLSAPQIRHVVRPFTTFRRPHSISRPPAVQLAFNAPLTNLRPHYQDCVLRITASPTYTSTTRLPAPSPAVRSSLSSSSTISTAAPCTLPVNRRPVKPDPARQRRQACTHSARPTLDQTR